MNVSSEGRRSHGVRVSVGRVEPLSVRQEEEEEEEFHGLKFVVCADKRHVFSIA